MFKKILKWTIYAGVVGLLIFGAVIRTEAKAESSQPEMRLENKSSQSSGQGGEGSLGQTVGCDSRTGDHEEDPSRPGQGSGRNGTGPSSGKELLLAEEEVGDWIDPAGIVTGLDAESLWIDVGQEEDLEITGRAWRFILENGFLAEVGDEVALEGFFENDEFKVSWILDVTNGEDLRVREVTGRPMWAGGR